MEWRLPERAWIGVVKRLQIEAVAHHRDNEPCNMVVRHEVVHARRQQQRLASDRSSRGDNACSWPQHESDSRSISNRLSRQAPRVHPNPAENRPDHRQASGAAALHCEQFIVAKPRRTVLRRNHRKADPARCVSLGGRLKSRDPRLSRPPQRRS